MITDSSSHPNPSRSRLAAQGPQTLRAARRRPSSEGPYSSFGVIEARPVCLLGASGTPWKSRIVRDRAALARLLPPEPRQGDDPRSPPRRGSSLFQERPAHGLLGADSAVHSRWRVLWDDSIFLPASNQVAGPLVTKSNQRPDYDRSPGLSTGLIHRFQRSLAKILSAAAPWLCCHCTQSREAERDRHVHHDREFSLRQVRPQCPPRPG